MCGICGFTRVGDGAGDRATLKAMCDVMAHRGPDGEGLYLDDGIALGHRRLSLIDLAGGGQPMVRATGDPISDVWSPAVSFHHVRGEAAQVASEGETAEPLEAPAAPAFAGAPSASDAAADPAEPGASPDRGTAAFPVAPAAAAEGGGPGFSSTGTMRRGRWAIVFNGEIYNYRELRGELASQGYAFETGSDTEVLLVGYIAWGEEVLARLRGMFAFAVWDARDRELFCARDFFGIKPFYYTVQGGRFVFASEIKSILEHPAYSRELNEEALAQYLCFQFSALQETFFKGVYKLPQGHCLRVRADGTCSIRRYWRPRYDFDQGMTGQRAVDEIARAMRESVRYHNVADVEVGSFLSSGIDSSYLAALLSQENPGIKTFTVGFSEYRGERDEISWAQELAGMLHVENDSKHISQDEFWDVLPTVQWHMDEPSADPSAVALYFVDQIAARRVKAVLSGEGADEFFAGYRIYQAPLASARLGKVPRPLLRAGSKALHAVGARGSNYLERASEGVGDWYYTNANGVAFSPEERNRVLSADLRGRLAQSQRPGGLKCAIGLDPDADREGRVFGVPLPQQLTAPVYAEVSEEDEVTRMQYVDLWFWLVGDILLKTDKMSMAHSLESRVPFLDRKVFEVSARIPASAKVDGHQTKIPLRGAAMGAIPREWAEKEKLGFPVPLASWLREEGNAERIASAFRSDEAAEFFDVEELSRLLGDHRSGKADNSRRIWIVYSFLVWYRVYFVDRAKPVQPR